MKFTWRTSKLEYRTGEDLYINKICVAGYSYNGSMSKSDTPEYRATHQYTGTIYLPGLTDRIYGETPERIKLYIELRVNNWFTEINRTGE